MFTSNHINASQHPRWFGHISHLTRKIVFEMTYNVLSGTLDPTIHTHTYILSICAGYIEIGL